MNLVFDWCNLVICHSDFPFHLMTKSEFFIKLPINIYSITYRIKCDVMSLSFAGTDWKYCQYTDTWWPDSSAGDGRLCNPSWDVAENPQ